MKISEISQSSLPAPLPGPLPFLRAQAHDSAHFDFPQLGERKDSQGFLKGLGWVSLLSGVGVSRGCGYGSAYLGKELQQALPCRWALQGVCRWGWGRQLRSRRKYYNPSLATRFHVHAFSGPSFDYLEYKNLWREWIGLALRASAHQEGMEGPEELGRELEGSPRRHTLSVLVRAGF